MITFDDDLNVVAAVGASGPRNQIDLIVAVQDAVSKVPQDQRGLRRVPGGRWLLYPLRLPGPKSLVETEDEGSFLLRSTAGGCELLALKGAGVVQIQNGGLQA